MSTLDPAVDHVEARLVAALRGLPPGDVREALLALVDDLAAFAQAPRCTDAQADGVPCTSASTQCDRCRKAAFVLRRMRTEVPH
jgi:hypothetical protein